MAALIKNIPQGTAVPKGNRGLNFSLHTEWYSLLNLVPDLVIHNPTNVVIAREPLIDTALLTEESAAEQNVFFVIPANPNASEEVIGTDPNGLIERVELI